MELAAIYSILPTPTQIPRKFAFIGSGPLPLTSICILQALSSLELSPFKNPSSQSATVLNIDLSPAAITTSQSLCWALGSRSDGMEFLCADAAGSSYDLWDFHIVYLAALVGSTQEEKEDVLVKVVEKMRPGAVLVMRSAERARRLMYPVSSRCEEEESEGRELMSIIGIRSDDDESPRGFGGLRCCEPVHSYREFCYCWEGEGKMIMRLAEFCDGMMKR
jgi:hypothetical protein